MTDTLPIQTATAPDYAEYAREQEPVISEEPAPHRPVYQRPLFREMQAVLEMPPLRTADQARPSKPHKPRAARRVHEDQQSLDFAAPRARAAPEQVMYCKEPVASPVHRTMASAFDVSMILTATVLFALTFQFGAGGVEVNAHSMAVLGVVAAVFGLFYHVLFALLGEGRTPGMAWVQLDLLNFDGRRPTREQRMRRLAAGVLSLAAAGLGLLWALVDEEKLTWHDHISRTFPTPREEEQDE